MKIESLVSVPWTGAARVFVLAAIATLLGSCANLLPPNLAPAPEPEPAPAVVEEQPKPQPVKPPPPSPLYEWEGTDGYVSRIVIDVDEQKARFYDGDQQIGWTTVASGTKGYPTPIGQFAVIEKVQDKRSNLYGGIYNKNGKLVKGNAKAGVHSIPAGGHFKGASMPYFLRLTNDGIGMHAGPIPRPGSRASHGCIRMPKSFAPILFNHVDIGTPVTIEGRGPSYASYLAKQQRSQPKTRPTAVAKTGTPPPAASAPIPATADSTAVTLAETTVDGPDNVGLRPAAATMAAPSGASPAVGGEAIPPGTPSLSPLPASAIAQGPAVVASPSAVPGPQAPESQPPSVQPGVAAPRASAPAGNAGEETVAPAVVRDDPSLGASASARDTGGRPEPGGGTPEAGAVPAEGAQAQAPTSGTPAATSAQPGTSPAPSSAAQAPAAPAAEASKHTGKPDTAPVAAAPSAGPQEAGPSSPANPQSAN